MEGQLTASKLLGFIRDIFTDVKEPPGVHHSQDGVKHFVWIDEDGRECSAWEIRNGNSVVHTGDGGIELYEQALKDALKG